MEDLKELEEKIIDRLNEIRNKGNKTANEIYEYTQLQDKLKEIHNVMIYIKRMKENTL
jgi:hypothetical protein